MTLESGVMTAENSAFASPVINKKKKEKRKKKTFEKQHIVQIIKSCLRKVYICKLKNKLLTKYVLVNSYFLIQFLASCIPVTAVSCLFVSLY